jgi:hypothetical protein
MTVGMAVLALTVLGYTRLPVDGHYWPDLLPLYLLFALGLAFGVHPGHHRRVHRRPPHQAGLASGLLNTSQQVGGAIGVAVSSTIFVSRAKAGNFQPARPSRRVTTGRFSRWRSPPSVAAIVGACSCGRRGADGDDRAGRRPSQTSERKCLERLLERRSRALVNDERDRPVRLRSGA